MAKTEQKKAARVMFVEHGKSRRDIAALVGVREKTVGDWASDGNWEELRAEHIGRQENVVRTLKELVQRKAQECLDLDNDPKADPGVKAKAYDALSKATKALDVARGENDITLSVRVRTMEWVFEELQGAHPDIYRQLLDFQESLLEKAARLYA
ncbi:MAG: DUF1804 family protein [Flavobacteriales bacterium]|nr:DUF1804 family protein [Flavobacteriales bacterium]